MPSTACRIVMVKTRGVMAPTEQTPEMLEGIIEGHFPRHNPSPWPPFVGQPGTGAGDEEWVTDVELAGIAKSLSVGKAPGPDGVPILALKVAIAEVPEMFRSAMLGRGSFPRYMKKAAPGSIAKGGETTRRPFGI